MHTPEQLNAALAGRYEVERQVGQGGMATVFLARDLKHHRSVALKVLSSELAAVVGRERFLSEIEVTANLHHPNLLPLFDSGEIGGILFYVMPYIEGESLRTRLEREKQLSMEDAVHIAASVGSALDYAHRHGVIHRDLKPENILMHERDPLVMDFGIALAVSNAGGTRVTQAGISLGTPQYMSPEQATGDRKIDARSDIYALGAVTYEMIAGEPPHTGSSLGAIMAKVIADRPQSLHELRDTVPEYVEAAVMRALSKIPADRFASAADFVSAITGAKAMVLTAARRPAEVAMAGAVRQLPIAPEEQPLVRRRTLGFAAVGVVLAALGGAIGARAMHKVDQAPQGRYEIPLPDSLNFSDTEYRQVALAKDGSRAVFQFRGNYPGPLHTRRTGQMHFDIIAGTDSSRAMAIAPSGKEVLFWVPATAFDAPPVRLMKIPIEGGAPVKLADSATAVGQGSWGDDNHVIFRRGDHLVLVSSDAGPERDVAWPDTAHRQYSLGWPEMLPGSKSALITILHGRAPMPDSQYLGTVNIADGKVTDLGVRGLTPHFANGHALYVRADGELFARPFDVKKGQFTGEAKAIAKDVSVRGSYGADFALGFTDLSVSETGMIMFTDGGPFRLGGGGGARRTIIRRAGNHQTADWLQVPGLAYQDLRASPDGSMLALTIQDTLRTSRRDVFVYTFATGQLRQLTRDGMSSHPVWSPDGARIIFRVTDPGAKPIRRFFSEPWNESEKPTPFAGGDGAESIELSPNGKWIAYVRGDSGVTDSPNTNSDIFIAPIDSPTVARPFAAMGIRERMPRFSPNGKWLAYVGHEIPSTSGGVPTAPGILYVRPVPGPGAVTKVSLATGFAPLWSSDGHTLYYWVDALQFAAAHVSESPEFKVLATDNVFTRGAPRTSPQGPTALWTTDMLPNGDLVYLVVGTAPTVSSATLVQAGRGSAVSAAQVAVVDYQPKLIAIVNWLGAESPAKPPQ